MMYNCYKRRIRQWVKMKLDHLLDWIRKEVIFECTLRIRRVVFTEEEFFFQWKNSLFFSREIRKVNSQYFESSLVAIFQILIWDGDYLNVFPSDSTTPVYWNTRKIVRTDFAGKDAIKNSIGRSMFPILFCMIHESFL